MTPAPEVLAAALEAANRLMHGYPLELANGHERRFVEDAELVAGVLVELAAELPPSSFLVTPIRGTRLAWLSVLGS